MAQPARHCGGLQSSKCGVTGDAGHFHGLIAVDGDPWVLADAAESGTKPGCGDCRWSIVLACATESPTNPGSERLCVGAVHAAECKPGQLLYRIFLTTDAFIDQVEGVICLGRGQDPIPIGDQAAADVTRYTGTSCHPTSLSRPDQGRRHSRACRRTFAPDRQPRSDPPRSADPTSPRRSRSRQPVPTGDGVMARPRAGRRRARHTDTPISTAAPHPAGSAPDGTRRTRLPTQARRSARTTPRAIS
jgi:hypothetical protein